MHKYTGKHMYMHMYTSTHTLMHYISAEEWVNCDLLCTIEHYKSMQLDILE